LKIQVEDKIFIESDERQFILKESTGKFDDKGNALYKNLGYFATVNQALKHFVKLNIMKSEAKNVSELITDIERIENNIEHLLKKH
jgi:hypothetical protein